MALTYIELPPVSGGGGGAVDSVFGRAGAVIAQSGDYTKAQVGLGNVDNTSDLNKPISTATQTALDAKQNSLGFTPENITNKTTNLTSPDNIKYPTTQAVSTALAGKQDSLGFTPENVANKSTSTSLGSSDTLYPSQNAVKSYVDTGLSGKQNTLGYTAEDLANKSTSTSLGSSNTLYPTQNAVRTFVRNLADAQRGLTFTGTLTWTGTTAPSGITANEMMFQKTGPQVSVNVFLVYSSAGTANTAADITNLDTPLSSIFALYPPSAPPGGWGVGANTIVLLGSIQMYASGFSSPANITVAFARNSTNTGWQFRTIFAGVSTNVTAVRISINYLAAT